MREMVKWSFKIYVYPLIFWGLKSKINIKSEKLKAFKFSKPEKAYNVKGVRLKNCIYFVIQNYEDFDDIYKMLLQMSLKNLSMRILKGQGNSWLVVTITLCQCQ